MRHRGSPSNLMTNRMCDTPELYHPVTNMFRDTLTPTVDTLKGRPVGCWRQPALAAWGHGASSILSGNSVVFQQVQRVHTKKPTPTDKIHTRKHYRVSAQRLYADCLSHWTTARQLCLYTQVGTQVMPLRESVWQICLISSIGCLHGILITHFFFGKCVCFPSRKTSVYRHNRHIFSYCEFRTHSIATSLSTWSGSKTEHQAKLSQT